ncbi:NUDIX domain-containing protein [Sphingomonas sp. NSE70-1]|uniref:NUDIX domain-containing protein n=1 Tax=Sphingomonas caseinilyticus TaxID=2908205 RepID=A0ABT0RY89_9SPHN|nr:NUDIX domain-containing protein [Sphingomonas caseinilyticus]MCL6699839.1 NUDIX domain-containing protein [Sphingomonas caseinilyticus]
MGGLIQLAYRAHKTFWKLFRPRTRGVKVMLFNDGGEVLLIRNSYGSSDLFVLPGGGVRPWENPIDAARREIREELGVVAEALAPVSTHFTSAEGKRDTIFMFEGNLMEVPQPDRIEVAEARFFALNALPEQISPATTRRLAERSGEAKTDGSW